MPRGSKNGMYTFDRFKLDSEKLMLYRDEIEVTLPPKIVKTLAVLIENRGSILSKDELIEKVWEDSIVEESNLSQNLYVLRKTLGTKPDGGQYIETLRRRGYRFNAEVVSYSKNESVVQNDAPFFRFPLIGREKEIDEVVELLLKDDIRLVTVSGVGGVGKTTFARSIAERMRADREVFFVELASVTRPELVVSAIANALGVKDFGDGSLSERIKEDLDDRSILIVLDNFEQVVSAAPFLIELATSNNRGLRMLVTSRVPLRLKLESIYVLPPLQTPEVNGSPASLTELSNSSAVHLFVERARQAQPKFDLTSENAKDVANICTRLGGLPLAIELAAARMRFMSPSAVLKRLEKQLDFLQGVKRDAPDRQQTMRETIAWSYDLLNEQEQNVFARLGVFSGGFDLSAAEFVCSDAGGESTSSPLEVITSLVEHNLLTVRNVRNSEPRIFMLEVVREFAEEILYGQKEFENARNAHAEYFVHFGEEAEPQLLAARSAEWLDRLEIEHDNLRASLTWLLDNDPALGQRLAGAIWRFWWLHGHIREACQQLGAFLSIPNEEHSTRAKMLVGATFLNRLAGNSERSRTYAEEGVKLAYSSGDLRTGALSLNQLGFLALDVGDFAKAERNFGMGLKQAEELGDIQILALLNNGLGELSRSKGEYRQAAEFYGRALGYNREAGDKVRQTTCLINLGATALMQNDRSAAGEFYRNGLEISSEMEDMNGTLYCLEGIAGSYWALHDPERASLIFGAAHAGRQKNNLLLEPADQLPYEESVALVRKTLGTETFNNGFSNGGQLDLETAISLALVKSGSQLTNSSTRVAHPETQVRNENVVVERQGNVLRLVDWVASKDDPETDKPLVATDERIKVNNRLSRIKLISWGASAAVLTVLIVLAVFGYRNWFASATTSERKELSITRLTNTNYVRDAMISPDGNFFVYNEDLGESSRVWLHQTGTATRKEIIPGGKWQVCCKTFTPDGKYIYFLASGIGEKKNALYRIATLGGTLEKILDGVNSAVSFSPNGEQMAFLRYLQEQKVSTFVIASSDGKGEEREIYRSNLYSLQAPAWSPDGKKVAFASPKQDSESLGICTLSTLDLNTKAVSPVSAERWGTCFRIAWLPDGSGFAMVGTREGETNSSKRDQVYLISYPAGQSRRLTIDANRHEPDSLAVTNDGAILAVPYNRSSQIWVLDANGDSRSAKQLTSGTADGRGSIVPLTDGRIGYTARSGDDLGVWTMNGDGTNPTQVGDAAAVQDLQVTPDGKYFVYANENGQESVLYRMGIDGSDPVPLTDRRDFVIDSTVSPDGSSIVYDVWKTDRKSHDVVLKRLPLSGGEPFTLRSDDCSVPLFSPDGTYISCIYFAGPRMAILSAKDGSIIAEFEPLPSSLLNPGAHWTPDSSALVYIVHQKNVCNVWRQSISGGKPEQLTDFTSGSCYNLEFSTDGSRLYLARGDELRDAVLITNYK